MFVEVAGTGDVTASAGVGGPGGWPGRGNFFERKTPLCWSTSAAFLDYVYMTRASTLKVGHSRYGVNLREDGMVLDDGLILRVAPDKSDGPAGE